MKIEISAELFERLRKIASENGFTDVDRFAVLLLESMCAELGSKKMKVLSQEEESVMEQRLKNLGYLG